VSGAQREERPPMVEVKFGRRSIDLPYTVRVPGVTEELFDELVDEDMRAELIDGVLVVHSPASMDHDDMGGWLRTLMRLYADGKRAGKVLGPDSLVHLATCRRFAPDVYFLRRERIPVPMPKEFEGAPDLVLEVLSPSNRDDDLDDKRPAYRQAKVSEIWLVDPENHQVLIDRKRRRGYGEEVITTGRAASSVLAGFWLDVAWLWGEELPDALACLQALLAT
jgi:Uma2 family endonuclease